MNEYATESKKSLEPLSEAACWHLLPTHRVGRLAVVINGRPDIFPVNYRAHDHQIFVRTAPGLKLAAAVLSSEVAFEVDAIDEELRTGWSIVIRGQATELESLDDLLFAEDLEIEPFAAGSKNRVLQITPVAVTGRLLPAGSID